MNRPKGIQLFNQVSLALSLSPFEYALLVEHYKLQLTQSRGKERAVRVWESEAKEKE